MEDDPAGCGAGSAADDQDVVAFEEDVARGGDVVCVCSPEKGGDGIGLLAGDIAEEGGEEVVEAVVGSEEGGYGGWGGEVGGD